MFHNIGFLGHINFGSSQRKRQDSCHKLPKDRGHISDYVKQSYLNGTDPFRRLHHVAKCPEREEHGIESI